jgi:hypothetical protein
LECGVATAFVQPQAQQVSFTPDVFRIACEDGYTKAVAAPHSKRFA